MKITGIEIRPVLPRSAILRMTTDAGITGLGEAVLEGRGRTVRTAVDELAEYLIGKDPRRIEHHWQAMYRGTFYRGGPVLTSAISGVEQAMWDILGKSLNVPVYQLLGGAVRDRIRLYKAVGGATLEELRSSVRLAVDEGYTMVKTGLIEFAHMTEPPAFLRRVTERMEAIREIIGPDRDFALDLHARTTPELAIRLAKELEPLQPLFIEEPCPPENIDAMAAVARATTIPIATGERLYTKWAFRELLEKRAAAIVQPDLAHCGGIWEGRKIAAMAETGYVAFAPHNGIGSVNLAASLQVAATVPNFLAQEFKTLGENLLKRPFVARGGYVDLPEGPGLGIEIDEAKLEALAYPGDYQIPLHFHEDDGSFADW